MPRSNAKISIEELKTVKNKVFEFKNITNIKVQIKKDSISFLCADHYIYSALSTFGKYLTDEHKSRIKSNLKDSHYDEIIKFTLVDKEKRFFVMKLPFTMTDENDLWVSNWEYVGPRKNLIEIMEEYLPYVKDGVIVGYQPNWALSPDEAKHLDT